MPSSSSAFFSIVGLTNPYPRLGIFLFIGYLAVNPVICLQLRGYIIYTIHTCPMFIWWLLTMAVSIYYVVLIDILSAVLINLYNNAHRLYICHKLQAIRLNQIGWIFLNWFFFKINFFFKIQKTISRATSGKAIVYFMVLEQILNKGKSSNL